MTACPRHPAAEASLACASCRNAFCADCVVKFRGHVMCGPCKNRSVAFEINSASFSTPRTAMVWSLVGFFLCGLPAIVGLMQGFEALRRTREHPELPGRPLAVVAVVVGFLAVGLWFLFVAFFIFIGVMGASR